MFEICTGPSSLSGYRTMWHVLHLRHKIHVPRRLVESLMREVDPYGVEQSKHGRLHLGMNVSLGATFCWHIDGYDGFSIHGGVDVFIRRIIWLEVQRSSKNPRLIARYFFRSVKGLMDAQYVCTLTMELRMEYWLQCSATYAQKVLTNMRLSKLINT